MFNRILAKLHLKTAKSSPEASEPKERVLAGVTFQQREGIWVPIRGTPPAGDPEIREQVLAGVTFKWRNDVWVPVSGQPPQVE